MPIYEYYCKDCRDKFELLTTYTESEVDIECSKCHGSNVRKLFSVFARTRGGGDNFGDRATLVTAMISATTMAST